MRPPAFCAILLAAGATAASNTIDSLAEGDTLAGFRAVSLYLDAANRPFGARFHHIRTGYTLDLIQLQTVPQAFVYVNTYPTSDKGEPHTQEHLLVGKGNKGRMLAESAGMTLTEFTAFTMQWRTCYPLNTQAGPSVFYLEFERLLDALLHPDYSDEEIRREVRNFGVARDPATQQLRLEEKGTVYSEMLSTSRQQISVLYRALFRTVYGPRHPLALNAGGEPSGIREMLPEDIRKFHREHYFLGNMGSVVSLPKGEPIGQILAQLDLILNRVQPEPIHVPVQTQATLPPPEPAPAASIALYDYPSQNDKQPGFITLAWPPDRHLSPREETLFNLFLDNFSSGATSDLYCLFINSKTRKFDLGAASVFNYVATDPGHFAMIGLNEVAVANLTEEKLAEVRQAILAELRRLAAMPDGSPELREFNTRLENRIAQDRRQLSKFTNSPPGFGARSGSSFWMQRLDLLNKEPGYRKSLTMNEDYAAIEALLAGDKNIWKEFIQQWHLTDVVPYGIATRPTPSLLKKEADERQARESAETRRLMAESRLGDEQAALASYQKEYDAKTAELDQRASQPPAMKFIEHPPLTLDEQLDYRVTKLTGGVPLVASTFDNMTSATTGLALRLDGVPESDLFLLTLLPDLLTRTGVIMHGKPVTYEEMQELLRRQILSLNAGFAVNFNADRYELMLQGSGNDDAESLRAIEWLQLALFHPNWRPGNLARLRDLVDQALKGYRSFMQGSEERWVHNPIEAYHKQTSPLYLTTSSYLTGAHNIDRLRWMLKDAGTDDERASISQFLQNLGRAVGSAAERKTLLAAIEAGTSGLLVHLTPRARELAVEAAKDLDQILPDLPDATLEEDWSYLCDRIRGDLAVTPEETLRKLETLRTSLLKTGNARAWMVGSSAAQQKLEPELRALIDKLRPEPVEAAHYSNLRRIDLRLREHQSGTAPRFVGLFNPNMQGAVFNSITPFSSFHDTGREALLRSLTRNLFGGGGAHSVFSKTIGAGLAYSNGVGGSLRDGTATYYAERMPDVTQTLHFAIDTIRRAPREPRLTEYAMAGAFAGSNAAGSYEARARSIADDLTDGITPEVVKRFRQSILDLRQEPDLAQQLFQRIDTVFGPILPGYGPKAREAADALYFLIGNDRQFQSLETDVRTREDERVYKLYPRDFWLVSPGP